MRMLFWVLGIVALLFAGLFMIGPEQVWRRIGVEITQQDIRSWPGRTTDNWALACPEELDCRLPPTQVSPVIEGDADDLFARMTGYFPLLGLAGSRNSPQRSYYDVKLLSSDPMARTARFEFLSRRMRYPDILDVEIVDLGEGRVSILVLGRARVGLRDFGVNARTVRMILQEFEGGFIA